MNHLKQITKNSKQPKMLNVGCGRRFHADWVNVDLVPSDESVQAYDISKGLPFGDGHFDTRFSARK